MFGDFAVDGVLLVFARRLFAFHEEEFAAEEADAFAAVFVDEVQVVRRADVAVEGEGFAIFGGRRFAVQFGVFSFLCVLLGFFLGVEAAGFVVRVEDECAGVAVEQGGDAAADFVHDVAHAHDGRHAEVAREDGDMAGQSAVFEDEAAYFFDVELCGFGGGEVFGEDDAVRRRAGKGGKRQAVEREEEVVLQVFEFGGAFAQVFVFEGAHAGGDLVKVFFDGGGGGFAFVADECLDVVFEFFVGEQFAVAFEDGGFVFALFFEDAVVEGF